MLHAHDVQFAVETLLTNAREWCQRLCFTTPLCSVTWGHVTQTQQLVEACNGPSNTLTVGTLDRRRTSLPSCSLGSRDIETTRTQGRCGCEIKPEFRKTSDLRGLSMYSVR